MIKIVIISPGIFPVPPIKGGAIETWIYETCKYLSENKFYVYCLGIGCSSLSSREVNGNIEYIRFWPNVISRLLLSTWKLPFKRSNSFLYNLPYSFWCSLYAKKVKADIIHVHSQAQFIPVIKYFNPSAKIILHIHQISSLEEPKIWKNFLFKKVDLLIGVSKFVMSEINKRYPLLESKTIFLHNGVDIEKFLPIWEMRQKREEIRKDFGIDNSTKVILYVGRLVENKGAHILIEVFKKILNSGLTNLKLVICGSTTYSDNTITVYVESLYKTTADIKEKVIFTGYIPYEGIKEIFALADLLVIPSLVDEGFPLVAPEALASGLMVVANAKGGIPEIIKDNETGVLIYNEDKNDLEEKLTFFIKDTDKSLEFGRRGREMIASCFTWHKIGQNLEKIYEKLLE